MHSKSDACLISSELNQDWITKFINYINSSSCGDQSQNYLSKSNQNTDDAYMSSLVNSSAFENMSKNKFLGNLLKQKKDSIKLSIRPNSYYSDLFMNMKPFDSSFHLIVSTINDKVYQLFNNSNTKVNEAYERAQYLIKNKINIFDGHDVTTQEVLESLIECLPNFIHTIIMFFKEVPGINELDDSDFTIAINTRLFDFYVIQNAHLFIDGESYQILFTKNKNIQYTREWMNKIKGKEKNDILFEFTEEFNKLNLTIKEKALLLILCFTFPGNLLFNKY